MSTSSVSSSTSSTSSTSTTSSTATSSSSSSSVGSQLITALGLGTGIDMTNLATEIADAEYASQISAANTQLTAVQLQISEASTLQSDVANLSSSLYTLVNGGTLASTPSVQNSSVATASLPSGASGASSSYSLEVDQLAQGQVVASTALTSASSTTGSGTLSINFGTISGSTFTADSSKSALNVTVTQGETLTQIAQGINGLGTGVTAYVATTSAGAQLVVKGPSGADNAFTISATENSSDPGLSALDYDPSTSNGATVTEVAQDASFKIDGIAQTSSTNTITSAAPSLSLTLTGTNVGSPTQVTYSDPSTAITSAMTSLVSALNSLVSVLNTDMTYSSTTGNLSNDSGAKELQSALSNLAGQTIMPNAAAGAPSTLTDLGISVGKDGTFSLDTTTLASALASNPSAVAAMFTTGLHGVYGTIEDMSLDVSSATDPGSLAGSVTYYTTQQTSLENSISQLDSEQSALRTQLISQYSAANTSVASYKSTLSYLQEQISEWDNSSSSSSS